MLALCSGCQRHIKASPCPFCGTTSEAVSLRGASGWSRAQRLASAVLVSTTALACSKGSEGTQPVTPAPDPSAEPAPPTMGVLYGAPPVDPSQPEMDQPAPPADASASPRASVEAPSSAYGAPPAQLDSKKKRERQQAPAYGGPPPNINP